jgi:hypothetical protein
MAPAARPGAPARAAASISSAVDRAASPSSQGYPVPRGGRDQLERLGFAALPGGQQQGAVKVHRVTRRPGDGLHLFDHRGRQRDLSGEQPERQA